MPHFLHKGNEWGWMNRLLNVNSCAFFILISNFQLYPPLYLASLSQILIMSFLGFYGIKMCIFILTSFFIYFKLWFPLFSNIIYHICFYFPFSPYCIFSCSYCPWSYCSFWVFCLFVLTILLWSLKKSTIFISKTSWYAIRRRQWHPTPVLLPGKSHGWRSLVSCGPWGHEESDTSEQLHFHFSLSCSGEGNGNPLQCSCLENPRDGGAWWASVYGVTQSRTRLKRLSSSSNSSSML